MTVNPSPPTTDGPPDEHHGRTLGYAAILAKQDVTDADDPRVHERIAEHREWAERQRRRAHARLEDRETLTLGDFEDAGRTD